MEERLRVRIAFEDEQRRLAEERAEEERVSCGCNTLTNILFWNGKRVLAGIFFRKIYGLSVQHLP